MSLWANLARHSERVSAKLAELGFRNLRITADDLLVISAAPASSSGDVMRAAAWGSDHRPLARLVRVYGVRATPYGAQTSLVVELQSSSSPAGSPAS